MSDKRGIFGLEEFYDLQVSGETSKILDVFRFVNQAPGETITSVGYDYAYAAGDNPYDGSTVDRLDLDNDSANTVVKGNLPSPAKFMGTVSSQTHGYFAGGMSNSLGTHSQVYRIDYSNDTAAMTTVGNMTRSQRVLSGVGTKDYGYFAGGYSPSKTTIERIDFSSDSTNLVAKGQLTSSRYSIGAAGNRSYGYWAGGKSSYHTYVDRIDYSSDTSTATPKGPLTESGSHIASSGNGNYGYYMGRYNGSVRSNIDRIDYSNDTPTASPKGPLNTGVWSGGGSGNTSYGYCMGGNTTAGDPSNISRIQRLDFSSDSTTTSDRGNLTQTRNAVSAMSSRESNLETTQTTTQSLVPASRTETALIPVSNHGYYFGSSSPITSRTERLDMDNDTEQTVIKGPLNKARFSSCSAAGGQRAGHFIGGYDGTSPGRTSSHDRMDYSNDTATCENKATLPHDTYGAASTGNTDKGYWWGGRNDAYSPNYLTYVHRVDYSNSTITAMPPSATQGNQRAACGNQNYGWWMGAQQTQTLPYLRNWVYRFDYANDTDAASPRGPLTASVYGAAATGNANYGYVAGGSPNNSRVERVDYSNDTATALRRADLEFTSSNSRAATGNSNFGYFNVRNSKMNRIDYSNDTATLVSLTNLPSNGDNKGGTSPVMNGFPTMAPGPKVTDKGADGYTTQQAGPAYAYGMGGPHYPGGPQNTTTVQRVDYGNDTATAVVKGPLSVERKNQGGAGNASYGYNAGGHDPSFNGLSSTDRIDYASDSSTASPKGTLTFSKAVAASVSNDSYGWFGGGNPSPVVSSIDRLDFSNDTATASPKGPMTSAKTSMGEAGNASYGYFTGGGPSKVSSVDRIDYSNDSATASPKGPLSSAREALFGFGNMNYGYFGGNYTPSPESIIDRIDYSNDTATASVKGPLNEGKRFSEGAASASGYGYAIGGNPGSVPSTTGISRVEFANDTATALSKGTLSAARAYYATASAQDGGISGAPTLIPRLRWVDSALPVTAGTPYGYSAGGASPGQPITSRIDRLDFSNDTANTVAKGNLVSMHPSAGYAGKDMAAALGNTNFAYFAGGNVYPAPDTSQVSRLDYANDSADCVSKGPLSVSRKSVGGTGNTNFGYVTGGTGSLSYVDRIDYSNDTFAAAAKGSLTLGVTAPAGAGTLDFGYFSGGDAPGSPGSKTIIQRIDYSNDTANTSPKGNLSLQRARHGNTGNKNFGYHSGGYTGSGYTSNVERATYSNDTATASPKGPLTSTNAQYGATGNQTGGYIMGGDRSGYTSTIEKIDYSNDTATATAKGNVDRNVYSNFATSGQINGFEAIAAPVQPPFPYPQQLPPPPPPAGPAYGYFAGGGPGSNHSSLNQRIDYASDTSTALSKGKLTLETTSTGGVSSNSYGYIAGGSSGSDVSTVSRIDYSNDSADTVAKGPITAARAGLNGIHNLDYGYLAGGWLPSVPGPISTIDRIDFASDSANATPKGNVAYIVNATSPIGNLSYGYLAGGYSNPNRESNVQRIDYSSDTSTTSPKGQLSFARSHGGNGAGNSNYGYVIAGFPSGTNNSTIDRIDYANDTATAVQKGPYFKTNNNWYMAAVGNSSYGYWSGDEQNAQNSSTVGRLDYSNDTTTAPRVGDLMNNFQRHSGVSARANGLPN